MPTDDYLFDGSGPPDPEVEHLEALLEPYRSRPRQRLALPMGLAMAAVALLILGGLWWTQRGPAPWSVQTASCDGCVWEAGDWLDTEREATAQIARRGWLEASPDTRIRRDDSPVAHFTLERGGLDVFVVAPPRWLTVSIPGVDVVDLGCAYSLTVAEDGTGIVAVSAGSVRLEGKGDPTYLHAGTMAATWPEGRTGLPIRRDAPDTLVQAADAFDRGSGEVEALLAEARTADAVTLWQLLFRVSMGQRAQVLDRLEELLGEAFPVDRGRLIRLDPEAMETALARVVGQTL